MALAAFVVSVVLHEIGHLLAARLVGAKTGGFTVTAMGPGIRIDKNVTAGRGLAAYLGGTFANLLIGAVSLFLVQVGWFSEGPSGRFLFLLGMISIALAICFMLVGITLEALRPGKSAVDIAVVLRYAAELRNRET